MPAYSFTALDTDGKARKGTLEADTARAARAQLRTQSLIPLQVDLLSAGAESAPESRSALGWKTRVLRGSDLALWTRQLAELVVAGLPLERALHSLTQESENPAQRNLNATLRACVNGGTSFANALAQFPREFSGIYVAVVQAGEQSGSLGVVLQRLADDLDERQALKTKLLGAALYPAIVSVVALVIVLFLMTYVVPQVAAVFAGTRQALPALTVALLAFSHLLRSYGLWLVLGLLLLATLGWGMLKNPATQLRVDAAWLRMPLLGRLTRTYNGARFAGTMAMLSSAGVPILSALQSAAETLTNRAMRQDALDALLLVREGAPLASALGQKPSLPSQIALFARLGEQTGQLPAMLDRVARQLSTDVQRRSMQLATVLEPLLIVAMGLVVMLIVLAVLMPIIQLNQWTG